MGGWIVRDRVETWTGPSLRTSLRLALGIAVPLVIVALAWGLWWISDQLLYIGPLDRATFGWAVVIPIWLAAPVAAGFAWSRLSTRDGTLAALVVGIAIGLIAAAVFWQSVIHPDCVPTRTPADWLLPSLLLGGSIGGGLAASALLSSRLVRQGRRLGAVIVGSGTEIVLVFATILFVAGPLLAVPGCDRTAG